MPSSFFLRTKLFTTNLVNPSRAFCYQHYSPRRTPRIMKRIAGGHHKRFASYNREPEIVGAVIDHNVRNEIDVSDAIHRNRDRIATLHIFQHFEMVPVAVAVNHAHAILAWKSGRGKPTRHPCKRCFLHAISNRDRFPSHDQGE